MSAPSLRASLDGFTLSRTPIEGSEIGNVEEEEEKQAPGTSNKDDLPIYVDFGENDPRNPMNASRARKWTVTFVACGFTGLSAAAGSTIALGFPSMLKDLNCTTEQAATVLSTYCLGFGVVPLFTAAFSEEFGRRPLFMISSVIFALMHLMMALAKNVSTVIIARFISGAAGSTGATMVGGVVADIWAPAERGLPMSIFALSAVGSTGLGPVVAGWVEQNPRLQWRWIQWLHLIVSGTYVLVMWAALVETRVGILLTREARKLRKRTGDNRYRARVEDEVSSLKQLIIISITRPIYLLLTEPVVASFSLWVGFAWGILYSQIESIPLIFTSLYHFSDGEVGLAFLPMVISALIGFLLNLYQERLYVRNVARKGPEARLYAALVASVLFPIGCFIYAWTALPSIKSWVGPVFGILVYITALFTIYLAVFSYLADTYNIYASSALAGQSLCRNLMATAFPLFTDQMYNRLTFRWASTLFGIFAAVLAIVPFILFAYGPQIRARSRFAQKLTHNKNAEAEAEADKA